MSTTMKNTAEHPAYLQHHFSEPEQQHESVKFGMWLFLLTEVLLFGGLFLAYAVFRAWNYEMFLNSHQLLDVKLGTLNTIVLITSSVSMALAIRFTQMNDRKKTLISLFITLALAAIFLVVKYFEYSHKIHEGLLPGKFFTFSGIEGDNPHIFFSLYFMMTGLHGIHIVAGMSVIVYMIVRTWKSHFSSEYYTPLEVTGLYWHLVDLIWIFLFPLFYLIG